MKLFKYCFILISALLLFSCSQKSNSLVSRSYHNMAARYNCYFLAKEEMLTVDEKIRKNYIDDYNYILPYTPPFDSTFNKSLSSHFKYITEKAIIPLQKHKNSNWIAESYNIIGKSKWLENKPDSAIYVYKYVIARVPDIAGKQMAQILLLRAYVSNNEPRLAEDEFFQLKKQQIDEGNVKEYHIACLEYLYINRRFKEMTPHLEGLLPLVKNKDKRARINFILGQIHQRLKNDKEAFSFYKKSLKRNPPYEIEFNAKLNISQVTDIESPQKLKKVNRIYDKMLVDAKNLEYHGRIYYERGKFELKQENLSHAVYYLNKSLEAPNTPAQEKTYAYLLMGRLHYSEIDTMPSKVDKYVASKLYYDSAVANMNPNFENAELILERQKILSDFVDQLEIVEEEEKLQLWASLSPEDLKSAINEEIAKDKAKLEREENLRRKREIRAKQEGNNNTFNNVNTIGFNNSSTFFAYDPIAIESNKIKFNQSWEGRPLEDNWRRSNKSTSFDDEPEESDSIIKTDTLETGDSLTVENKDTEQGNEKSREISIDTNQYISNIPNTPEKLKKSSEKLMDAKYRLAKIYYYDLEEIENARDQFISYLELFPDSKYEAEVIYFLYLIAQNDTSLDPNDYVTQEKNKYPNSIYSRLMDDANYLSSNEEENRKSHNAYEKAFNLYKTGDFLTSRAALDRIKTTYPKNDIPDKVQFLKILTYAKTDQLSKYFFEMNKFTEDFGTSPLKKNAEKILKDKPENINASAEIDEKFYRNDSLPHFFVGVFKKTEMPFNEINRIYNEFRGTYYKDLEISTKRIQYSDTTYLIVNKTFNDIEEAKKYYLKLMDYHDFGKHLEKVDYSYYLVTEQNYRTLLATKNLNGYSEFYRREYKF